MNADFPQNEREQLEAKLTALLLGELPADEAIAMGKAMERDPKLVALYEQLKATIGLVRESASHPAAETAAHAEPLKLSEERREKLLAKFKTITPKEFTKPTPKMSLLLQLAAVLVIAGFLAEMLLPSLSRSKEKSMSASVRNNLRQIDGAKQQWALENNKSGDAEPTMEDLKVYLGRDSERLPSIGGEKYVPGKVSESPVAELSPSQAKRLLSKKDLATAERRDGKVEYSLDGPVVTGPVTSTLTLVNRAPSQNPGVSQDSFGLNTTQSPPAAPPAPKTEIVLPRSGQSVPIGEPEWIGVLETPAEHQQADNKFVARYGYLLPGQTVDSASIHNQTRGSNTDAIQLNYAAASDISEALAKLDNTNLIAGASGKFDDKTPVLGDVPALGKMFRNELKLADSNGSFNSELSRDDLGGLRYTVTNGIVASQPVNGDALKWESFDGTTNTAMAGPVPDSSSGERDRQSQIVLPTPLGAPANHPTIVANGGSMPSSGFGGGGGAGGETFTPAKPVMVWGAKQVEIAAAANAEEKLKAPDVAVNTKFVDVNQNSNRAAGLAWYADNFQRTNDASLDTLNSELEAAKQADIANATKTAPYFAAKEELENEKRLREVLAMRTSQEGMDNLPTARMVDIPDPATAAPRQKEGFVDKLRETFSGKVERSARINVESERPDIAGPAGATVAQGYDPYFRLTEFETIKSYAVLKKAVENLKLDGGDKSKTEAAVQQLKKNIDVSTVKNTKFIEISAKSEKPEEAARLANAVAEAYKQYRAEEFKELKNQEIQSMQQQLVEQDQKVKLAQAKAVQLARELNISVVGTGGTVSPAQQTDTALPKPVVPPPTPQPEILTRENSFSTFSLNVSDVSFKLAAASLEKGQMPEPASIRSEEFINAFNYRDPDAAPGVPIAFASERARYPFAHNRELLRFSLKTAAAGRQAGRPLNIVLLLDNSGSMERADRVRIIQEALRVLAGQLQAADTFSIVTFARTATLRVDGVRGDQAAAAAAEIAKLTPEGGTNLGDALDLAYETALHHYLANGDNRVVLLTDGAANLGDVNPTVLKQKVEAHRKQGVALDCFGIGWEDYNDDLLEVLTRNGDGRYGFINTPEEATTEFVAQIAGALHVAASDVKVQVEFNPKRVASYRQIGYAKHQLTKEQFRDNTVDAAEIAAQEAGNALYTIETNPQGEGSIATVRVRYKVPGTGEYREQAWDVPYTGSAVALEQASPAMRLATTASAFSEWLATSPFAGEVTTDQLLQYLNGVPKIYGADTRPAKLEWMIRQAKSISGK